MQLQIRRITYAGPLRGVTATIDDKLRLGALVLLIRCVCVCVFGEALDVLLVTGVRGLLTVKHNQSRLLSEPRCPAAPVISLYA